MGEIRGHDTFMSEKEQFNRDRLPSRRDARSSARKTYPHWKKMETVQFLGLIHVFNEWSLGPVRRTGAGSSLAAGDRSVYLRRADRRLPGTGLIKLAAMNVADLVNQI